MEYISVLQVALAVAALVGGGFFPVLKYLKRPKLIPYPEKKERSNPANKYFGFAVENKGKNVARNVSGEVEINNTSTELINWNNPFYRGKYNIIHTERGCPTISRNQ
jgi:hypothetical protein